MGAMLIELAAGGACVIAGMCIGAWLTNHAEQRTHDRGQCKDPGSGRC